MRRKVIILVSFMLVWLASGITQSACPQESDFHENGDNWDRVKTHDDIIISMRSIQVGDSERRVSKASVYMDQPYESILQILVGNSDIWTTLNRMQEVYDFNVSADQRFWNSYCLFDMPWPFKNQDLVIQCHYIPGFDGCSARIEIIGVPDLLPTKNGIVRVRKFKSVWLLEEIDSHTTHVQYVGIGEGQSFLPRWVTDPIVQRNLIALLENLRYLSEATSSPNYEN